MAEVLLDSVEQCVLLNSQILMKGGKEYDSDRYQNTRRRKRTVCGNRKGKGLNDVSPRKNPITELHKGELNDERL